MEQRMTDEVLQELVDESEGVYVEKKERKLLIDNRGVGVVDVESHEQSFDGDHVPEATEVGADTSDLAAKSTEAGVTTTPEGNDGTKTTELNSKPPDTGKPEVKVEPPKNPDTIKIPDEVPEELGDLEGLIEGEPGLGQGAEVGEGAELEGAVEGGAEALGEAAIAAV